MTTIFSQTLKQREHVHETYLQWMKRKKRIHYKRQSTFKECELYWKSIIVPNYEIKRKNTKSEYIIEERGKFLKTVLHPGKHNEQVFYNKLPIKTKGSKPSLTYLKILWENGYLPIEEALYHFKQWNNQKDELIMQYFNKWNTPDKIPETNSNFLKLPIKRRGNEAYHKYTWSKLQGYKLCIEGYPFIYEKTTNKKPHTINFTKNRTIELCNTLFFSLTYEIVNPYNNWKILSEDINRYMTNIKNKLLRRNNKLLYYIKALESHDNNNPHVHIIAKLKEPVECYRYYSRKEKKTILRPFNKKLLEWKNGHYDIRGIDNRKDYFRYITKYITKSTNKGKTPKEEKTLALTWISKKRLYSTSMIDFMKMLYPETYKFLDLKGEGSKCTIQRLREYYYEKGLKFSTIQWDKYPEMLSRYRYAERRAIDLASQVTLKLELRRLNNEGYYQVVGIRRLLPSGSEEFFELFPKKKPEKLIKPG